MAKHTPAPWTLHDDRTIWGPNGRFVADLDGRPTTPVDDANAKLIAAAPDLLVALQNLADFCQDTFAKPEQQDDLIAARAALAKAGA